MSQLQLSQPSLVWETPDKFENFKDHMLAMFAPLNKTFKNRQFECDFLERVRNKLVPDIALKLDEITDSGKICIVSDLAEKSQHLLWSTRLAGFFWSEPWILVGSSFFSLQDYIQLKIGNKYRVPNLIVSDKIEFDGFAWGLNTSTLSLFASHPLLQKFYDLTRSFDPSSKDAFTALGPNVGEAMKVEGFSVAGFFRLRSEIFISPSWPPSSMVELLTHECGHVFHGENSTKYGWDAKNKILSGHGDAVHSEGVAESFAWMLLRDLYTTYPEIEFFHLGKLRTFAQIRQQDPHLIGAAMMLDLTHSENKGSFLDIVEFAESSSLTEYLNAKKLEPLTGDGESPAKQVPVYFSN